MNTINCKQTKKHCHRKAYVHCLLPAVICAGCNALTGCKKFLDVPPQDKVPQATLFNDEQGFKDALMGVYLGMDKPLQSATFFGLYTSDLTMGMMSTLAYDYDNATVANAGANGAFFNNVVNYYYTDGQVKNETDGIWARCIPILPT